jgi:Protein of unknown function (DUF3141)
LKAGHPCYFVGFLPHPVPGQTIARAEAAAFTSDLGNGKFDGSWLVQNFENQNSANTLWTKQYNLYSKIDTEASRYLGFERILRRSIEGGEPDLNILPGARRSPAYSRLGDHRKCY